MATRRSRLSVKPNLGPKLGGPKSGSAKPTTDKKGKQTPASVPKKETLERLRKKVTEDDNEKEEQKDKIVTTEEKEKQTEEIKEDKHIQKITSADNLVKTPSEVISPVKGDQSTLKDKDAVKGDAYNQNKTGKEEENTIPVLPKLPVAPKNKVQMITRNRLPKARPNLSDAGRPKKASDLTTKGATSQNRPSSPMKSPRPIISQSPIKALSSPEKSAVVARELQVHYPATEVKDSTGQSSKSEARAPGETTVAERRHRNLSGVDVPPIIERRQRQMSTSEGGEKRHRHASVAETTAPKRRKPIKVDAPLDVPVDRTKIKMGDLIYWNPTSNPMKKKPVQEKKKKSAHRSDEEEDSVVSLTAPTAEEEKADDPGGMEDEAMPVPQVKIGPDGSIVINEESLVIKNNDHVIEEDDDIIDETDTNVTYTSFRKQRHKQSWSEKDTEKFYKALSHIGTDFSLIHSVFPKRSRDDIKKKFAIEDRKNRNKVEAALRNKKPFNLEVFKEDNDMEVEIQKTIRKPGKRARKENKTVEKATRPKQKKEWKYYYNENEGSESVEAKKAAVKRQQVEEARKRLLATRNSSQNLPEGVEESSEIVEILMNMSKGDKPVPPAPETPHVENVMVMQSGMPVVDVGTNTEQLVQLLQTSGQAALIGDNVNEPLILVYNKPTVPGGETVIHVYKIQPEGTGSGGVTIPAQQTMGGVTIPAQQTVGGVTIPAQQTVGGVTIPAQQTVGGVTVPAQQTVGGVTIPAQQTVGGVTIPAQQTVGGVTIPAQQTIGGVTIPAQQIVTATDSVSQDSITGCVDVNIWSTNHSSNLANTTTASTSGTSVQAQKPTELQSLINPQAQLNPVICFQNQGTLPSYSGATETTDHNSHINSESVSRQESNVSNEEQVMTPMEVASTASAIQDQGRSDQQQISYGTEEKSDVTKESEGSVSELKPFSELSEQYIDDVTSVVAQPLQCST